MTKNTFIKFPSIGQFRDAIKQVQSAAKYHNVEIPKVTLRGTVKLHGTNAAVVINKQGEWWCQSRERVITPESDNAGFAAWVHGNKTEWDFIATTMAASLEDNKEFIQIYGEWCGGNIQKGVGLQYIPKQFIVFSVRYSGVENPQESNDWETPNEWPFCYMEGITDSFEYPMYELEIDFNTPTLIQNKLIELTEAVEKDCPVARQILGPDETRELIGEGIVWEVADMGNAAPELHNTLKNLRFKVKGEKHSASKVKTIAAVDEEKVKSIEEFVEYACTENRLKQGLDKLTEMGLEHSTKSTGDYIRWVMQDILKEELSTMIASGIEPKDVNGTVARKAREYFMKAVA